MWVPPCDCPESQDILKAQIVTTIPAGYQRMSNIMLEAMATAHCANCGKLLKPAGCVGAPLPPHGMMGLCTLPS
jgi:hypothetical protein